MSQKIKKIILHCSDSSFGNALLIDKWHRERGFDCIGYHALILNGYTHPHTKYNISFDGHLSPGRHETVQGAHAKVGGNNKDSYGLCFIGTDGIFSPQQFRTSKAHVLGLLHRHNLSIENILGHYEVDQSKTCPTFDLDLYREYMTDKRALKELAQKWHDARMRV